LRDRRKHLPDDFAVFLPERRGITPYAYSLLVGLHQPKYTYWALTAYTDVGLNREMRQNDPRHIQRHYFRIADNPEVNDEMLICRH
jgi:hypothetical protein